jgi:NAD(P)-dependent dehydrogenase (short-subunit alcohol dehydrogenase family)
MGPAPQAPLGAVKASIFAAEGVKVYALQLLEDDDLPKTIVITGAGGGLGRTLAESFAADGDNVVLLGRTLSKVEDAAAGIGERAMAAHCDVSSPDSVRAAFAAIAARHPTIDVLINNAAIFIPSTIAEASDELIVSSINTNLTGAILCARAAIPMLPAGGQIINVTSESVELPFALLTLYQCSKAGLERFSTALQIELEKSGIRVSYVRAGQMVGENMSASGADPALWGRFFQSCLENGLNLMQRPVSRYPSLIRVFRTLIDMPPDLHVEGVKLHARAAGA